MIKLLRGRFEDSLIKCKPDLVIADPPDNIGKEYESSNDRIPVGEYLDLLEAWLCRCCQCTDGPVFFIPNQKWMTNVEIFIDRHRIKLIQRIIWHFSFGQHHASRYASCFRPIYWLNSPTIYPDEIRVPSARQLKYNDKRAASHGRLPGNVWDISLICGTFKEKRAWHQCQLPEALVERIIKGHSKPGDLVFDPFVGSGTTAIVCQREKRNCVGMDCSQHYLNKVNECLGGTAEVAVAEDEIPF